MSIIPVVPQPDTVIFKYRLFADERNIIRMTKGSTILKVGYQDSRPYVWIEHPIADDMVKIEVVFRGTGERFVKGRFTYIDTLLSTEHGLVFHFYWKYGK